MALSAPSPQPLTDWSTRADHLVALRLLARDAALAGGHDPRSNYVERFWLPILGPSTTWLIRVLGERLGEDGEGVVLGVDDVARALGVSSRPGRRAPLWRALRRAEDFNLLRAALVPSEDLLEVALSAAVPTLSGRLLDRLPPPLLAEHRHRYPALRPLADGPRRADQLAATLVALGEDDEGAVRQLVAWRIAPGVARASVRRARNGLGGVAVGRSDAGEPAGR